MLGSVSPNGSVKATYTYSDFAHTSAGVGQAISLLVGEPPGGKKWLKARITVRDPFVGVGALTFTLHYDKDWSVSANGLMVSAVSKPISGKTDSTRGVGLEATPGTADSLSQLTGGTVDVEATWG